MGSTAIQKTKVNQSQWTNIRLKDDDDTSEIIQVSNASLSVPVGLDIVDEFMSQEESLSILEQVDSRTSALEGFEQRRRVQRYSLLNKKKAADDDNDEETVPSSLRVLAQRVFEKTGHAPRHVSVEEFPKSQLARHFNTYLSTVTTFEHPTLCSQCPPGKCSCFVAVVPICSSLIELINRPKERFADCWDLHSPNHGTGLVLNPHTLYVKTQEFLWDWRSRISAAGPNVPKEEDSRFVVVKFHSLPAKPIAGGEAICDSKFGYVSSPDHYLPRTETMPPLEDLLTIIVTTSPIKSNPTTELLERVFQTFLHGGNEFALNCRKVIVCDGCRQRNETVSKRHANTKQAMRNGIVDGDQLENYNEFKLALRSICESADEDSPFWNTAVEELDSRQGYGFALRHALRECVSTPYVIVIQHDRTFMRPTPIAETVNAMWNHQNIKFVGMSMRSNLMYRDHFMGKYGKTYNDAMRSCILRPDELSLGADLYGPDSHSTQNMECFGQEKLRENIQAFMETYKGSKQNEDHVEWMQSNPPKPGNWQLSLTPTFFWYDNVHICETAHYRDFVFNPLYKMVVRGGFVEDKLSPVIKKTVERLGLVQGHARFGCYLLDDHSGMFFTGHLDGGSYMTAEARTELSNKNRAIKSDSKLHK